MPDPNQRAFEFDTDGDERGYCGSPEEQTPGHTPGTAEGEDEDLPHREHPYDDPDKTPGKAEG